MTDNEIIKAFEICYCDSEEGCGDCPYKDEDGFCEDSNQGEGNLLREVFYLINRQQAEIERLKGSNLTGLDEKTKLYLDFRAELDRICVPEILKVVETIPITHENKTVGLFCVAYSEHWKYIDCIYIQPEHRRKGIGAAVVKGWYKANKDCEIRLHIINNNKPALEFWSNVFELQVMEENSIDTLYRVKGCKDYE